MMLILYDSLNKNAVQLFLFTTFKGVSLLEILSGIEQLWIFSMAFMSVGLMLPEA